MLSGFPFVGGSGRSTGLVSAFGSALHGYHRRPPAFYPAPLDLWLAALMDAVPFYQRCMMVCPSTMSDQRARSLLSCAREHLPLVRLAPLRRRQYCKPQQCGAAASHSKKDKVSQQDAYSVLPAFISPLEDIPPRSLDLVVFAGNVFGEEMLHDAPWHMSLANRCLDSHGVVAIMGYATRVRVAAPETARRDADDFLEALHRTAQESAERTESEGYRVALKRAVDITSSLDIGHADTYFPFLSTRRRWFLSEYAATPTQLAASYRALPEYQLLCKGARFRSSPFAVKRKTGAGEKMDTEEEALNVLRHDGCVDPLEALQGCLQAQDMVSQGQSSFMPSTLRVHVRHFVITCSSRSVNALSEEPQLSPVGKQLPQLQ